MKSWNHDGVKKKKVGADFELTTRKKYNNKFYAALKYLFLVNMFATISIVQQEIIYFVNNWKKYEFSTKNLNARLCEKLDEHLVIYMCCPRGFHLLINRSKTASTTQAATHSSPSMSTLHPSYAFWNLLKNCIFFQVINKKNLMDGWESERSFYASGSSFYFIFHHKKTIYEVARKRIYHPFKWEWRFFIILLHVH